MKLLHSRALWGVLLILVGVLFLLESLAIMSLGNAWAVLFVAAGAAFGYVYVEDRSRWWALIPALTLVGIGGLIGITSLFPEMGGAWGAGFFLAMLSLGFWSVYFTTGREQWWAIIPGGVLLALGLAIALEPFLVGEGFVGIFFLGMGLTFGLVYVLPTPEGRMGWALIPAGILGAMGLIFLSLATPHAGLVWPLLLILIGGYILLRNLRDER
jgi:hypothetical protein